MKREKILKYFIALTMLAVIFSCNKPEKVELANEGSVYMPQAVGNRAKTDLVFTSTNPKQEVVFGAAYGGLNKSSADNNVSFVVDAAKIASYNAANATNYVLLPTTSYDISGLSSVIANGQSSSNPLIITVKTNTVTLGTKYILPITLTSSSNGAIDNTLQTSYFRFDTLLKKSIDVTGQGTFTVQIDNGGGPNAAEGSLKLVDGDYTTKLFHGGFTANEWYQFKFAAAVAIGAYTLTSANDTPTRDPKTWKLTGSNDGTNYTDIDTRTNEAFADRNMTRRFEVAGTPASYLYYRLVIVQNNGSPNFQMAEIRMIKYE
jgi:hypothetical protein